MDIKEKVWEGVECIDVAQIMGQWRTLVNMGCVKGGRFLESPSNCELVKKASICHEVSMVSVA